jgi:hypothetical protein
MPTQNSVSTHVLVPMSKDKATLLATRLLGAYPSLNLHDPETFMTELVLVFLKYPLWVGERAVVETKKKSPQFVPSVPLVEQSCEEIVADTRTALTYGEQWDQRARLQLEERAQIERAQAEESPEYRREVVARLWPSGLINRDRDMTRKVPDALPLTKGEFRQFSAEDLRKLYPPKDGPEEPPAAAGAAHDLRKKDQPQ